MRAIATIALLATVLAVASASGRHVFFTRSSVPSGWTMGAPAPKDAKVGFMIALKQRNLEALEALFWAVSTPGSPQYQQYQTIDQILELVAPEHSCHDAVVHWLRSHGHVDIRSTRDALEVTTTVEVASKLFEYVLCISFLCGAPYSLVVVRTGPSSTCSVTLTASRSCVLGARSPCRRL
jgi:hypothetical protein